MSDELRAAIDAGALRRVVDLYLDAAAVSDAAGDTDNAGFLRTQAWIYALEAGDPRAGKIRAELVADGRERDG